MMPADRTSFAFRDTSIETTMLVMAENDCNPFVYYPQQNCLYVPAPVAKRFRSEEWIEYRGDAAPFSFIHPENVSRFTRLLDRIRTEGADTAEGSFNTTFLLESFTVRLITVKRDSEGRPAVAFGRLIPAVVENALSRFKAAQRGDLLVSDVDSPEAIPALAAGIASQFYAIFAFDLVHDKYVCYQDKFNNVLEVLGPRGPYLKTRDIFIEKFIHHEDRPAICAMSEPDVLAESFRDTDSVTFTYRSTEAGWTRGTLMALKRDGEGRATVVLFMAADITREMTLKAKAELAESEARQDPLTGMLSRKAYDELVVDPELCAKDMALLLIDIDHFKSINDTYGHETGDEVLIRVGALVKSFFRSCDLVIRMGGDEIAVVLQNFTMDHWEAFRAKLPKLSERLAHILPDESAVTLSCGLVFSVEGFKPSLYTLADKALYHTKSTGRAGCTLVDGEGNVQMCWRTPLVRDNFFLSQQELIASSMKMMFRNTNEVAFIKNADRVYVAATDAFAEKFCGGLKAEDVIGKRCEEVIADENIIRCWNAEDSRLMMGEDARLIMQQEGKNADGSPYACRLTKYALANAEGHVAGIFGVGFDITEEVRQEREAERTEEGRINRALANLYIAANYADLRTGTFRVIEGTSVSKRLHSKVTDIRQGIDIFVDNLIDPEFRSKVRAFLDIDTLEDRLSGFSHLGCVYRSLYSGWCRCNVIPVMYDEEGHLQTFLLMVSRVDTMQAAELEKVHEDHASLKMLFAHVPGGLVMYRINPKTFEQKAIYVSPQYEHLYGNKEPLNVSDPNYSRLHPDDREEFLAAVKYGIAVSHKLNRDFRVWNDATHQYMRVNLNAVAEPQEDGTILVYALFSDISNREDSVN